MVKLGTLYSVGNLCGIAVAVNYWTGRVWIIHPQYGITPCRLK